ncbi:hypothetical protein THIOKS11350053 [Thiocapsa sp. KS1]|nr:hypothetical protein THIOKS11350053 [Thiocapsa sp. KS1]
MKSNSSPSPTKLRPEWGGMAQFAAALVDIFGSALDAV